ncbi:AAA family ATPase [Rheinheimera sp. 4Y26]|uniref:AAA family ATPase n=1 Tax=Rheinheimera sp. 4Y26 TaxID=2977811 RepID=UPI0021B12F2C|nr:AAA family ATPase [Rheinheimera sp. 4Y26]MCT6699295.1 AAA family ATPase [Rheinheimera sp. 4Y26]
MSDEAAISASNSRKVSLKNLYLDPNNFRLIHEQEQVDVTDDKVKDKDVAGRTLRLVIGEKNQNVQDLIDSFKSNGYLPVDQIQVRRIDNGYVVVEGNRRIAALKILQNEHETKSIDLGKLDPSLFSSVPVVLYDDADEVHHLTLMGLKHISGNRKWGEWNQAKLLEALALKHGMPEDEICKRIAISKMELRRSIRALAIANQYISSDYGDQFNESMFPIFREAARNTALKDWIGWDETNGIAKSSENAELFFSWMSRETDEDLEDSDSEYSGKSLNYLDPVITRRDDIVTLSKIIKDPSALDKLKQYRNLNEAFRTSDLIFKEKIKDAISSVVSDVDTLSQLSISSDQTIVLEEALGKLRTIVEKSRNSNIIGVEQKSVFYDKIDSHFSSIKIINYKSLSGVSVNKISKINLFAGLNNSGKTTFLEAVYLLCKQNDFNGLIDVIRRRAKITENHIPAKWLADQITNNIHVEGVFDQKQSSIEIRPLYEESRDVDRTRYLKSIEMLSSYESVQQEAMVRIYQGRDRETQADSIKLLAKVAFSSPFFLNEAHHYTAYYHKSVQSKLLPEIFKFIREKIIPSIKDIRLVDEFQRFLVTDDSFDTSIDLTSYGEGLQRIFFTSLLFASCENGVILIDEFENAIHTDLLSTFVPFIHSLATKFNVQVFLTSHSKECIDSFITNIPNECDGDFSFHAFVRKDSGNTIVREFSGEMYRKILEAGDVDLRKAK